MFLCKILTLYLTLYYLPFIFWTTSLFVVTDEGFIITKQVVLFLHNVYDVEVIISRYY